MLYLMNSHVNVHRRVKYRLFEKFRDYEGGGGTNIYVLMTIMYWWPFVIELTVNSAYSWTPTALFEQHL